MIPGFTRIGRLLFLRSDETTLPFAIRLGLR